jgi:hypothetical protein
MHAMTKTVTVQKLCYSPRNFKHATGISIAGPPQSTTALLIASQVTDELHDCLGLQQ